MTTFERPVLLETASVHVTAIQESAKISALLIFDNLGLSDE